MQVSAQVAPRGSYLCLFVGSRCLLVAGHSSLVPGRFQDTLPQMSPEGRMFSQFLLGKKQLSDKTCALYCLGGKTEESQGKSLFLIYITACFECLLGEILSMF